jgi:hypothetical protein
MLEATDEMKAIAARLAILHPTYCVAAATSSRPMSPVVVVWLRLTLNLPLALAVVLLLCDTTGAEPVPAPDAAAEPPSAKKPNEGVTSH